MDNLERFSILLRWEHMLSASVRQSTEINGTVQIWIVIEAAEVQEENPLGGNRKWNCGVCFSCLLLLFQTSLLQGHALLLSLVVKLMGGQLCGNIYHLDLQLLYLANCGILQGVMMEILCCAPELHFLF